MQRPPLPVREDMRFQEKSWLAQRIGWLLLAVFIGLAISGVLSRGVLSGADARREGVALTAEYERFQRRSAVTYFTLHVPRQSEDEIWLQLGRAFQDTYEIESIQPPPARSNTSGGINLFFDAYDQGDLDIVIRARPRRFGAMTLDISRSSGRLQFPVLIFP